MPPEVEDVINVRENGRRRRISLVSLTLIID
jgi:hypothetical protein